MARFQCTGQEGKMFYRQTFCGDPFMYEQFTLKYCLMSRCPTCGVQWYILNTLVNLLTCGTGICCVGAGASIPSEVILIHSGHTVCRMSDWSWFIRNWPHWSNYVLNLDANRHPTVRDIYRERIQECFNILGVFCSEFGCILLQF